MSEISRVNSLKHTGRTAYSRRVDRALIRPHESSIGSSNSHLVPFDISSTGQIEYRPLAAYFERCTGWIERLEC